MVTVVIKEILKQVLNTVRNALLGMTLKSLKLSIKGHLIFIKVLCILNIHMAYIYSAFISYVTYYSME